MKARSPRRQKDESWYRCRRKKPSFGPGSGPGRPKSSTPLKERREASKAKYRARLEARGVVWFRTRVPIETAAQIQRLAQERGISPGELLAEIVQPHASSTLDPDPATDPATENLPRKPPTIRSPELAQSPQVAIVEPSPETTAPNP